ncbi:TPA: hypothetical protein MIP74_17720 [Klebsiella pneumoniae]|nr:hypothetical protein DMP51_17240 [Klebsiella pneumoniae]RRZ70229.1 hypothetical protein EGK39_23860 [Klebsiella oxytoca]TYD82581.1 hypothetical protein DJ519_24300 [Klebsiella michiganensis]HBX6104402.1 hypothetical protein [Klebsiella pneumoniae]HBY1119658.1 hypothetical protein [Klebsiella pneumoniae]
MVVKMKKQIIASLLLMVGFNATAAPVCRYAAFQLNEPSTEVLLCKNTTGNLIIASRVNGRIDNHFWGVPDKQLKKIEKIENGSNIKGYQVTYYNLLNHKVVVTLLVKDNNGEITSEMRKVNKKEHVDETIKMNPNGMIFNFY